MKPIPQVRVQQFIKAKRERVFQAWLDPQLAVQWFSPENLTPLSFRSDAKVGGTYTHVMTGTEANPITTVGKYLEIIKNERLVFTWGKEGKGIAETIVTVELVDQPGGTLVTLTHIQLPEDLVDSHVQGWTSALCHLDKFFKGDHT